MSYNKENWQKYQQYKMMRDPSRSAYWRKYNAYKKLRNSTSLFVNPEKTMNQQLSSEFDKEKNEN